MLAASTLLLQLWYSLFQGTCSHKEAVITLTPSIIQYPMDTKRSTINKRDELRSPQRTTGSQPVLPPRTQIGDKWSPLNNPCRTSTERINNGNPRTQVRKARRAAQLNAIALELEADINLELAAKTPQWTGPRLHSLITSDINYPLSHRLDQ